MQTWPWPSHRRVLDGLQLASFPGSRAGEKEREPGTHSTKFPFSTHAQEPGNEASLQYTKTVSNQKLETLGRPGNKVYAKLYEHVLAVIFLICLITI